LLHFKHTAVVGIATGIAASLCGSALAATRGRVSDLNGAPLAQAMVTLTKATGASGATATTVFTDDRGEFEFAAGAPAGALSVRSLGYRQIESETPTGGTPVAILM